MALRVLRSPARRALFGFAPKQQPRARDTDIDPGFLRMRDLAISLEAQTRPPSAAELVRAFNSFFLHKSQRKEAVNSIQAQTALDTFMYLRDTNTNKLGFGLSLADLQTARDCMANLPADKLDIHKYFSVELFEEISRRKRSENGDLRIIGDVLQIIRVLALTGESANARKQVEDFWKSSPEVEKLENPVRMKAKMWNLVLRGFAKEQNEEELLIAARSAEDSGVPYNPTSHEIMTTFYAAKDDVESTKVWYYKKISRGHRPHAKTMGEILRVCLRKNEDDWCNSVFRSLLESNPSKPTWDVIFQWAVSALGKSVEDIERMMEVMVRRNAEDYSMRPDPETINGLVEFAISRNDPYLAERYLALGSKLGIQKNAKTFIQQMGYRIDAGDLSGAQAAYDALQGEEVVDLEDIPVINRYIRALCVGSSPNHDRIDSLVADLDERKIRPEADTVSALSLMFLKRGELEDAADILRAHTFHYTLDERARIRNAFLTFCLDRRNSTESTWNVYQILREVFGETDVEMRTQVMNDFFDRNRSDLACLVFGHMRQHDSPDMRPTSDTYVQCLQGIAKCEDMNSLDMVHNMMKMDTTIEPSTKIYNALMLAYTALRNSDRALDLWTDITNSIEGPTYNSLQIVFQACEVKIFGHKTAKEIWNSMRRMEIEVTPPVFSAYVGALGGSGLFEEGKALIEGMENDVGYGPDMMTLGIFYNAMLGDAKKKAIEDWARDLYPEKWAELEKVGQRMTEDGIVIFNIVREWKA